jgi:phosphoglycolate phosphatase-like HAD superfamily hydrolase
VLLVLWDIDGTLVDSAGHGRRALEDAYRAVVGRPYAGDIAMAGRTDHQIAMAMLGEDHERLARMLEELAAGLAGRKQRIRAEGRPHPGAHEALEALAARDDVIQSVLTGNLEVNAAVKLSAFGLDAFVDFEVGGYGSDPHSERADLVAVARERAEAEYGAPTGTVLIGDTPLDVRAAHTAGARAIAVATGPYRVDELREAGADAVLEDLRDTPSVLAAVIPVG